MDLFSKICSKRKIRGTGKVSYNVTVSGDTNDGDYATTEELYTKDEFEKHIIFVLYLIRKYYSGNGKLEDVLETEEGDTLYCLIPSHSDYRAHTLDYISIDRINGDGTTSPMNLDIDFEISEKKIQDIIAKYFKEN